MSTLVTINEKKGEKLKKKKKVTIESKPQNKIIKVLSNKSREDKREISEMKKRII